MLFQLFAVWNYNFARRLRGKIIIWDRLTPSTAPSKLHMFTTCRLIVFHWWVGFVCHRRYIAGGHLRLYRNKQISGQMQKHQQLAAPKTLNASVARARSRTTTAVQQCAHAGQCFFILFPQWGMSALPNWSYTIPGIGYETFALTWRIVCHITCTHT